MPITKERLEELREEFEKERAQAKEFSKDPETNRWGLAQIVAWDDAMELLDKVIEEA